MLGPLSEVRAALSALCVEPVDWRLVDEVKLHKQGDAADLLAWFDRHATFVSRPDPGSTGFVRLNQIQPMHPATAASLWTQCPRDL
jgi:hypothetical protein